MEERQSTWAQTGYYRKPELDGKKREVMYGSWPRRVFSGQDYNV